MQTEIRHVGLVVKDLKKSIQLYRQLGFEVIERDILRVVKLRNESGDIIELVKGKWKPHIAINFYEDPDGNLLEMVKEC